MIEAALATLTPLEFSNWLAIYAATMLCCAIAMTLAVSATAYQLWTDRAWTETRTRRGALLFVPRCWWRWQKLYLRSTPVTLAIVSSFAWTLNWA